MYLLLKNQDPTSYPKTYTRCGSVNRFQFLTNTSIKKQKGSILVIKLNFGDKKTSQGKTFPEHMIWYKL
jgi:hypothetical protein